MTKQLYISDFRVASTRYVAYAAIILLIPFAINHFFQGRILLGVACSVIVCIFTINAVSSARGRPLPLLLLLGFVPILLALLTLSFYRQGIVAALWCYPVIMVFSLILAEKQAWLANLAIFIMVSIIAPQVLDLSLAIRVIITLAVVGLFSAIFIRAITNQVQRLEEQVVTDSLTGLSDRILLTPSLEKACLFGVANKIPMTLVALDLDHFKAVNDQFGHDAGDNVLRAVGELLRNNIRKSDAVFRLGGEEFLALLYKTDLDEGRAIAEKLRIAIAALDTLPGKKITCSFGVATFALGESEKSWMKRADAKLYDAKSGGRNCICS